MLFLSFQITRGVEYDPTPGMARDFLASPFFYGFFYFIIAAVIIYSVTTIVRLIFHKKTEISRNLGKVLFLLTVPRKKQKQEQEAQTNATQKLQEDLALAEGFFSSLGGLRAERGIKAFFTGRRGHFSWEVVA